MRLVLACVIVSAVARAEPVLTAVHTLADHHTIRWTADRDPLRKIAGVCRIVPGTPAFTLACEGTPVGEPRAGSRYYYGVALFRDLEETLYIAACASLRRDTRCNDLRAGRTFSAEVEEQTIRVVIDSDHVPLRILERRPKPVSIDSPAKGTPSQVKATEGSPSRVSWSAAPPSPGTPSQVKPSAAPVTAGTPSKVSISEVSVAAAAPTSGRLALYCAAPEARVFIDGKLAGDAPLEIPVMPGRHQVQVRAGDKEWSRTVVIPPGGTVKVTAELDR